MIKKIAIHVGISVALCLIMQLTGILSYLEYYEKLFIFALLYLLAGGYSFLSGAGYFDIQKYSFHKVSKRLPFLSRLFLNANSRGMDKDDREAEHFMDYKENFIKRREIADCVPLLITFAVLTVLSVVGGYIF